VPEKARSDFEPVENNWTHRRWPCRKEVRNMEAEITPTSAKKTRVRRSPEKIAELVMEAERSGSIAEICRREGMLPQQFQQWRRKFKLSGIEGLKWQKRGPRAKAVDPMDHAELKRDYEELKEAHARLSVENQLLKKSMR
jgi:hypothetical protein